MASTAAIIVAAGSGVRLGADQPKALVEVAGIPLVRAAVDRIVATGVGMTVVVAPANHLRQVEAALGPQHTVVVAGGATRTQSVARGLAAITATGEIPDVILVHDAARAFTPVPTILEVLTAISDDVVAAAPALPVADTLKRVDDQATIVATVDRQGVVAVQTPQAFRGWALIEAHATGADATDDLALVEELIASGAIAGRAVITAGSPLATKITFPEDIGMVASLLAGTS